MFQELSLCPNLTVAENARINHRSLKGLGWRRRAGDLILAKLDEIFPGHDIGAADIVRDLSIGRRQMVEVARAFTVTDNPLRLVILDEPTSSLDATRPASCWPSCAAPLPEASSYILISHLLGEVLDYADRIVVMRDGRVVAAGNAAAFDRDKLVAAMGDCRTTRRRSARRRATRPRPNAPLAGPGQAGMRKPTAPSCVAHEGEIIGLAGLAGHGQTRLLLDDLQRRDRGARPRIEVTAPVALVAGDRQADGIFPLWSIAENIGIRSIAGLRDGLLLSPTPRSRTWPNAGSGPDQDPHARRPTTTSCRCPAATSRRPCSRGRSALTPGSS